MKLLVTLSLIFQSMTTFAGTSDLRYSVDVGSTKLAKIITEGTYEKNGPREGQFFNDLLASAPELKKREIDEYYGRAFPYEIHDYHILNVIALAKAEGNQGIVEELQKLDTAYRSLGGEKYKQRFMEVLNKLFDQRIETMKRDFELRLEKHGGHFTAMLVEYLEDLKKLEHEKFVAGVKTFAIILGFGGATFATVFLGVPLIVPLLAAGVASK